jgi:glycosyltransferase involved in cell wall biosynthesis
MDSIRAIVVIPCYNERDRLDPATFLAFFQAHPRIKLLFVDDGSTDGTGECLLEIKEKSEGAADVLSLQPNRGKAEAVRQGMLHVLESEARPDYTGFWDADLATPLETIPTFCSLMDTMDDLGAVFGARVKLLGRSIERHLIRHYFGRVFATVASAVLRIAIYDTQCGAKLFRINDELRQILSQPFISRWVFDVEIVARYAKSRRSHPELPPADQIIYEYPLQQWHDVKGSKLRFRDFLRAAVDLIRIQMHYRL